jgi:hypothetical protein
VDQDAISVHRINASGKMQVIHVFRPGESFAEATLVENRVISRDGVGVSPQAILDTWNNPTSITGQIDQNGGKFMLGGQNATIVVNPQGKIITAWPNGSAGFRIMP